MNKNVFLGGLVVIAFIIFMAYGAFMQTTGMAAQVDSPEAVTGSELFASISNEAIFVGFPPTIPHPVENRAGNCNLCHNLERTTSVPLTPHAERTNCLQCHVDEW